MNFPRQFPLSEFERASDKPLTPAMKRIAHHFAWRILMPLRRRFKHPIYVTCFVQDRDSGAHPQGLAIDFGVEGNDFQKLDVMFEWAALYLTGAFGKLIFERDHLHATMPGAQGAWGEVFREPREGEYVTA